MLEALNQQLNQQLEASKGLVGLAMMAAQVYLRQSATKRFLRMSPKRRKAVLRAASTRSCTCRETLTAASRSSGRTRPRAGPGVSPWWASGWPGARRGGRLARDRRLRQPDAGRGHVPVF